MMRVFTRLCLKACLMTLSGPHRRQAVGKPVIRIIHQVQQRLGAGMRLEQPEQVQGMPGSPGRRIAGPAMQQVRFKNQQKEIRQERLPDGPVRCERSERFETGSRTKLQEFLDWGRIQAPGEWVTGRALCPHVNDLRVIVYPEMLALPHSQSFVPIFKTSFEG